MRFKNDSGSYTEMKITKYQPNVLINYKLIEASGGNYIPIDRGFTTDRYASTMTFRGHKDTIRSLVNELTLLRNNGKQIEIDEFEENVFGDNVNHSGVINCVVEDFGTEMSPVMNVETITITFLPTDLLFVGTPTLPSLYCLSHKWEGYADWNTHVNETYTRSNYFVDRVADTYTFKGTYSFSIEENKNMMAFHKSTRGQVFTIDEADWGVNKMFGGYITETTHDVIIIDMEYTRVSPTRRQTTISLVKI